MDLLIQDVADIAREEDDEGEGDQVGEGGQDDGEEGEHEQLDEETADEGDVVEENVPNKRRRGRDRDWQEIESFATPELYKASGIFTEIKSQMSRTNDRPTNDSRVEIFSCKHARKNGWKKCKKVFKVVHPQDSFEIVVFGTDDDHLHEEDPAYNTKENYHWTEPQMELMRRYVISVFSVQPHLNGHKPALAV